MKIYSASITRYGKDGWTNHTEEIVHPEWRLLAEEIASMDRFSKPIIWLIKKKDQFDEDAMAINGGNGIYHVQICLADGWHQYFDMNKSSKEIDVWTSDQGFSCPEYHLIFDEDLILKIVKYYIRKLFSVSVSDEKQPCGRHTNQRSL
jgi:hypothetical protein